VLSPPSLPTPVFSTARDWVLKLGLFNLTKPCIAGEWVWILDCSIQIGAMKCLLILGVRMEVLRERGDFTLSHADVEPIVLKTVESCTGEVVKMALEEAKIRTGSAVAIVSDEGSELKLGVRLFQQEQAEGEKPVHLHDIMHKADLVLKKDLENDCDWKNFTKQMTEAKQLLKQSSSSHLMPPKQYQKQRRMRSEVEIIEWGIKILKYLDSGKAGEQELQKLSWVVNYRFQLMVYQEMAILFDMCTKEVRERGYCQGALESLKKQEELLDNQRIRSFFSELLGVIEREVNKVPQGCCLLGCSEVIESTFGKFKQLEKQHASGGLTSLVISLASFLGEISIDIVKIAMETISIGDVKGWIATNLGSTFWSRRRRDLNGHDSIEEDYLESDDYCWEVAS
jgi:hypothetical protein